jgi:uncharacterized membrane protein YgaE (UPF0421/DUF939 family)
MLKEFFTSERLIHAIKTTIACTIGLLIISCFNLSMGQWLIITILVVMSAQIHFGAAIQKGIMRIIGSLSGALIAILTLLFFPDNITVFYIVLLVSSLFFSYMGGISQNVGQAGTLGTVTIAILLLTPHPDLHGALLRLAEIMLGIFIALIVSLIIFPIRARYKLQENIANTLDNLQHYYQAIINHQEENAHLYEEKIMQNFIQSRKLLDEAIIEPGMKKQTKKIVLEILLHEKRIFRAFSLLEHYLSKYPTHTDQLANSHLFINNSLDNIIQAIKLSDKTKIILPSFDNFLPHKIQHIEQENHFLNFFTHFISQEIPALAKLIYEIF